MKPIDFDAFFSNLLKTTTKKVEDSTSKEVDRIYAERDAAVIRLQADAEKRVKQISKDRDAKIEAAFIAKLAMLVVNDVIEESDAKSIAKEYGFKFKEVKESRVESSTPSSDPCSRPITYRGC